jgi:hypothetical protein
LQAVPGQERRLRPYAALLEHGLPRAVPDGDDPAWVVVDGRRKLFSDEVREVLLAGAA